LIIDSDDLGDAFDSGTPRYRPYSLHSEWRTIKSPIRIENQLRVRYKAAVIDHYIDIETGEVIPTVQARKLPDFWQEIRFSERCIQRSEVLLGLRKEVRQFAEFVLKFRNFRRGITPGIETLVRWYASLHGKAPHHVRRHVMVLQNAGLLVGDNLLGALFQIAGTKVKAKVHLGEGSRAAYTFLAMLIQSNGRIKTYTPFWSKDVVPDMSTLVADVMKRVRASQFRPRNDGPTVARIGTHQEELCKCGH
jgi:hypothetical protein